MAVKLSHEMSDEEIEVVANMLEQIGDTLSNAEGQMIASIAETKGAAVTTDDTKVIFEMMKEVLYNFNAFYHVRKTSGVDVPLS